MNLKGMLATKPIAAYQKEASDKSLKRALGIPALVAFGIGGIIGTGIFVLTGLAAAQHAGPAIVISFIIAGIGCMFAGLCYSEFAAMVPVAGSAYAYSYATLGECVAWFVGWNLILEYMMAASTVAVGWSRYFIKLLDHYGINFIPDCAEFRAAGGRRGRLFRACHRRLRQSARDRHRRGCDGALLQGHQGIGGRQHHHCRDQGLHRARRNRVRRGLRQHRELGALYS